MDFALITEQKYPEINNEAFLWSHVNQTELGEMIRVIDKLCRGGQNTIKNPKTSFHMNEKMSEHNKICQWVNNCLT